MATAILMKSGGGGAGSDELTASADKVLSGYTYVGADTDDEAGSGSMASIGALDAAKSVATGSNNVYFRISRGAHLTNSSSGYPEAYAPYSSVASAVGLTSAKLLKGQTVLGVSGTATSDANATAAYIYSGKTAYVNGSKITGSMSVSSLVSFSVATYSTTQVTATWTWPSKGPYSGIAICGKTGGYPANIGDSRLYTGAGSNHNLGAKTSAIIGGLQPGKTYYFAAWLYCSTSLGDLYSGAAHATAATKPQGQQTFTSSGTFTVPAGVTSIDVFCVGGGGAGATGVAIDSDYGYGGNGGGGGYTATKKGISVSPGQTYAVTIGAGATSCSTGGRDGSSAQRAARGSDSSFGNLVIGRGGWSGSTHSSSSSRDGEGGSGGSGGATSDGGENNYNGGSNGSDGEAGNSGSLSFDTIWNGNGKYDWNGAYGQGTTTRAFGETSGTLYSGGGGAGGWRNRGASVWWPNTGGGSGGGGAGGYNGNGVNGSANTGGGGGGECVWRDGADYTFGNGGSGIVLIRWGY